MITTMELHNYDRPIGRKAGNLDVHFAVDGTHHRATFPFRVDTEKGHFIAIDGDMQHIGETRAELVDHMKKIAASKIALSWTRYIEISYEVSIVKGPLRLRHHGLGPEDARDGSITSISLNFEVVEYSNKLEMSSTRPCIIRRKISDEGKTYDEERRWEIPEDALPFSQARLDALRHIQTAMGAIDDRMRTLFAGKVRAVATRLDTITNQQLALPAPEATPKINHQAPRRKKRP